MAKALTRINGKTAIMSLDSNPRLPAEAVLADHTNQRNDLADSSARHQNKSFLKTLST